MQDCGFAGLIYDSGSAIKMSLNNIAVTKPIYNLFPQDENYHSFMNLTKEERTIQT